MSRNYTKVTVDCLTVRVAVERYVKRYHLTYTEVALAADMEGGRRLKECLGIIPKTNGKYQYTMRPDTAAKIIRAIDRAPFEFGI